MLRIGKSSALTSSHFRRLVKGLQEKGKTCTVVESSCGGIINASIMAIPGSSAVYYGGSVAYNTKRAKKLLLNDDTLHGSLLPTHPSHDGTEKAHVDVDVDGYIQSKEHWTAQTAIAFCEQMDVDFAIAEGGATGPTFRPKGLDTGFAVIAVAGRNTSTAKVELLAQTTIRSTHANRELNMRLFADAAAKLAADTIGIPEESQKKVQDRVHLDRATHLRTDPVALSGLEARHDAKFVVLRNSQECLFSSHTNLAFLSKSELHSQSNISEPCFLGLDPTSKAPLFAVDVDVDDTLELPPNVTFDNTRTHAPLLKPNEYEIVLYATALSNWRRTHKYCSVCGQPLQPIQGGTCLKCTSPTCSTLSWPRQDPSIIVLVTNPTGDKALLARSPRHPPRMHTALAGFVEAGETFEQAVLREVHEETGAQVDYDSITYLSSQPWPFPRSCMIGFLAQADDSLPLTIDRNELISASWFDKAQVQAAAKVPGAVMNPQVAEQALLTDPSLEVLIPPKGVLARTLIDQWLEQE